MKWIRIVEQEPANYQEVLVVRKADYYIATFVKSENTFFCKNGERVAAEIDVCWAQLLPPGP